MKSCSLSVRFGYPLMPPSFRSLANPSRGRVSSLWTYAWWPVSQRRRSLGLSNTRWSARVSSTTPRLGPRWPPVLETVATRNWRISSARARNSESLMERRSAGLMIRSRTGVLETWSIFDSSLAKRQQRPSTGNGDDRDLVSLPIDWTHRPDVPCRWLPGVRREEALSGGKGVEEMRVKFRLSLAAVVFMAAGAMVPTPAAATAAP